MVQRYLECGFPLIPLVPGTKCPAAKKWDTVNFALRDFHNRNVGTRAGERIHVDGKEGNLLIVDFDSPDLALLKRMCASIPLERTTCIRTGGNHRGYHLFYLVQFEIRKRGMLAYESASVDLLGRGSYAVIPPSVVETPYKYLLGLEEIAFLDEETYQRTLQVLASWKTVRNLLKHVGQGRKTEAEALAKLETEGAGSGQVEYFRLRIRERQAIAPDEAKG